MMVCDGSGDEMESVVYSTQRVGLGDEVIY